MNTTATRVTPTRRATTKRALLAAIAAPALAVLFALALPTGTALANSETTDASPVVAPAPNDTPDASPVPDEPEQLADTPEPNNSGPDDLEVCQVDCGGDDNGGDPPDWGGPDDFEVCQTDCGGDGGNEEGGSEGGNEEGGSEEGGSEEGGGEGGSEGGNEDGGSQGGNDDSGNEEIPVPTRIDTGFGIEDDSGLQLWVIGATSMVMGAAFLAYRAVRIRS